MVTSVYVHVQDRIHWENDRTLNDQLSKSLFEYTSLYMISYFRRYARVLFTFNHVTSSYSRNYTRMQGGVFKSHQ